MQRQLPVLAVVLAILILGQQNLLQSGEAPATLALEENQVLIETTLISIDAEGLEKAGISWDYKLKSARAKSPEDARQPAGVCTTLIERRNITEVFAKLRECGGAVVMQPTVITQNGREASVQTGGSHPIPFYRTSPFDGGSWAIKERTHGTKVTFLPSLLSAERLLLDLTFEFSRPTTHDSEGKALRLPIFTGRTLAGTFELGSRAAIVLALPISDNLSDIEPRTTLVAIVSARSGKLPAAQAAANDETSALQSEIQELRRKVARLAEQLADRDDGKQLPSATRTVERAMAAEPILVPRKGKDRLVTKVYAVAELVVPVPDLRAAAETPRRIKTSELIEPKRARPEATRAEFAPLVELITSTIEPGTWEKRGGAGAIHAFETNLSLVISQTEAVHEQIAELLETLRRQQDHLLEIEILLVTATLETAEKVGLDLVDTGRTLSAEQAERVREAFRDDKMARVVAAPRVALVNKQLCELQTKLSENRTLDLVLRGSLDQDRELVRLNLAVNAKDAADAVRSGDFAELQSGETYVLDVTDRLGGEREFSSPILEKIPHVERLFKNVRPASSERQLLFISPKIRFQPES